MDYRPRVFSKDPKKRVWGIILSVLFLVIVFFPWQVLGELPMWFGLLPNWFGACASLIIVWVIAWIYYMGRVA